MTADPNNGKPHITQLNRQQNPLRTQNKASLTHFNKSTKASVRPPNNNTRKTESLTTNTKAGTSTRKKQIRQVGKLIAMFDVTKPKVSITVNISRPRNRNISRPFYTPLIIHLVPSSGWIQKILEALSPPLSPRNLEERKIVIIVRFAPNNKRPRQGTPDEIDPVNYRLKPLLTNTTVKPKNFKNIMVSRAKTWKN